MGERCVAAHKDWPFGSARTECKFNESRFSPLVPVES